MVFAILFNLLWILFGYIVGSINFSIILTKYSKTKKNIKEIGSGNAGATNALRSYGWRFGLLIFILDTSKSYWFAFLIGMLQLHSDAFDQVIPQLAILFVIIGHIFPLFFQFKGGKGASTLLGMISSISLILAAIGTIIFLIVVYLTRYVSLGSIVVPYILAALAFIHPYLNGWFDSVISYGEFWLSPLMLFIASMVVTASHFQNIKNLLNKNERKIGMKISKETI